MTCLISEFLSEFSNQAKIMNSAHFIGSRTDFFCFVTHGCPVGRICHLEVVHASDVLDDAFACVIPDVHAEG
jgi:hypothetical protein